MKLTPFKSSTDLFKQSTKYHILSSIMCIWVWCAPEFHKKFWHKKYFYFSRIFSQELIVASLFILKSHLQPFLSYLPCIVHREYFSIIFNVKKWALYFIKCIIYSQSGKMPLNWKVQLQREMKLINAKWKWNNEKGVIMALYHRVTSKCWSLSRIKRNGTPKVTSVFTLMLCESRSWELSFLLNLFDLVWTSHENVVYLCWCFVECNKPELALGFPALKGVEKCWLGSVLIYMTCE
jgi:hypothetical protein